jgi:hypothetical protein
MKINTVGRVRTCSSFYHCLLCKKDSCPLYNHILALDIYLLSFFTMSNDIELLEKTQLCIEFCHLGHVIYLTEHSRFLGIGMADSDLLIFFC